MTKSAKKTLELYNGLGTQEKRAVNRLMRGLSRGDIERPEIGRICRGISRACQSTEEQPKKMNGYIVYYKQQYPAVKAKMPGAKLGDIAKAVGAEWKKLGADERVKYSAQGHE
jgi:hypothetical protein